MINIYITNVHNMGDDLNNGMEDIAEATCTKFVPSWSNTEIITGLIDESICMEETLDGRL